jgi:hypothetical protein
MVAHRDVFFIPPGRKMLILDVIVCQYHVRYRHEKITKQAVNEDTSSALADEQL